MDYWNECISEAFEDAGINATKSQIDTVAAWVEGAHDNYGMANGYDVIHRNHERDTMFEIGKWYKTRHGHNVEFIRHKDDDGMYHVFRHTKEAEYRPLYTDEMGYTAYGDRVLPN